MRYPALITRFGAGVSAAVSTLRAKMLPAMSSVPGSGGWFRIFESFAGAWQSHVVAEPMQNLLTFSAVFSCVSLISGDIAKLRPRIMKDAPGGIQVEADPNSPFWRVLRKPNRYQTWLQFIHLWIISKLLHGNTYVLKVREGMRGMVVQLYILDPLRVTPLVAMSGDVYYQLAADNLSGLSTEITVPASEIIHDRGATLYHPLIGVPPIVACAYSATQGIKIQRNSATFFKNMSMPSGVLTSPGKIDDETAARLKRQFEENYSGANLGRVAVAGNGLKYELMTMPAEQAQLIDQLKWTVEDIARSFQVPLHMIGADNGLTGQNFGVTSQQYFSQTLQLLIEAIEALLTEGLELSSGFCMRLDLEGLLRMDAEARYKAKGQAVKDGWLSPNEARRGENLAPVEGGNTPYLQQQNFSLAALAKRDALPNPFIIDRPTANPTPSADGPAPSADPTAGKTFREYMAEIREFERRLARVEEKPSIQYRGVWEKENIYHPGDVVTSQGSSWICKLDTTMRPGGNDSWQLMVKRGRNGDDADLKGSET